MKIFILDDLIDRQERLSKLAVGKFGTAINLYLADSFDSAIKIFEDEQNFDLMLLDHDLGQEIFVSSSNPNTGYQVAKYITEHNIQSKKIIIHSLNFAGAHNMLAVLSNYNVRYIPCICLTSSLL